MYNNLTPKYCSICNRQMDSKYFKTTNGYLVHKECWIKYQQFWKNRYNTLEIFGENIEEV